MISAPSPAVPWVVLATLALGAPARGSAQHEHAGAPPDVPLPQQGSGTAWLPAAAPVRGYHARLGGWSLMAHGNLFVQYVHDLGTRRDYQLGSVNWLMAEVTRPLAGGTLGLRAMASAEPFTVTERGYPQLLQVAQPYKGGTLTDRRHPHDLIGEVALTYERSVGAGARGSIYLAPVGEPALGPVAYGHRPSATHDPAAPLGHHTQDVTHTSFGVITVGLFTRRLRVEGSVFNGAHPDEVRTNLDFAGARLDSYAARLTVNPDTRWSLAASAGHLSATGGAHAHGALHRLGLSVLRSAPSGAEGTRSTAVIWGANIPTDTKRVLHSVLVESNLEMDGRNAVLGRVEYVRRTAEDLSLVGSVPSELNVGALSLGYARRLPGSRALDAWLGARGTVHLVPEELRLFYGSRTPVGLVAYLQIVPPRSP